ncbi:glycosyltransferase family 2 protein [Roseibium sp. MMSF_3544]|uniref:glycosyltransferase family 2 protein n=1 Tax=unclassified Roseibium TaxID=2629323 RepID=UPI00273D71AA|nr:glycosyltransferase family 2 protein [Roseibium sp. MMSF_3544]
MTRLIIILPCFNEAESLEKTVETVDGLIQELIDKKLVTHDSYALYVDDGSTDETWALILRFSQSSSRVQGIRLSSNAGHQLALAAGMQEANGKCDACVSIDADLQQDPKAIEQFLSRMRDGAEVVYGVRQDRSTDGFFKYSLANVFYFLARHIGVKLVRGHADYRLLSAKALSIACRFAESDPFYRGIIPLIGLRSDIVEFEVKPREFGVSKYSFSKMVRLALTGITSFSIIPLRLIGALGVLVLFVSLLLTFYVLLVRLFTDSAVPGWASIVVPIYMLSGIQMISLSVIGEYVGRIFLEVKGRPPFVVWEKTYD